ncbi:hypothetical protein [Magnetospirillum sulfuroxidans]|uniref:DUF2946 domain-containing protein n=1 Tax=Magnetospirillum sulfuroxidans TaxID=611300 RepID=A0ABS5ID53_9PROT|nr:hypothetical protein [Magnetospirillum sulfuroxidans]MBR9971663.1 hypothetical protein [Magnetospirillum sulfuroxidans]
MRIWLLAMLVLFTVLVTAETARADDGVHNHHHVQQNQPADDSAAADAGDVTMPTADAGGGCHCMFTGCVPVLPSGELSLGVTVVPFRHPGLPVLSAWSGLGSPPPSEPPRA